MPLLALLITTVGVNTTESIIATDVLTRFSANEAIIRIDRGLSQLIEDELL